MIDNFCKELLKKIRDKRSYLVNQLSCGSISNMEQYKFITGQIKGLNESEQGVHDAYRALFGEDEIEVEETRNVGRTTAGSN